MRSVKKSFWIVIALVFIFSGFATHTYGKLKPGTEPRWLSPFGLNKSTAEFPPSVMVSWAGSGYLTKYTISNTGQSGLFEPPPGWTTYAGMWPSGYGLGNGRTGEFPRGTDQYYVWGAGLWIGAKSDEFNTANDKSVTVTLKGKSVTFENVRVATAAYYSDQSSVSRLWQTNQEINGQTDGKSPKYTGEYLFGQKNKNIEDYQEIWSYFLPETGDYYGMSPEDTIFRLDYKEINQKRLKVLAQNESLDPDVILLDPYRKDQNGKVVGDIVSDEDTYTVFGDFIKERYGSFLWTLGYDMEPLGIRVEQRTYSWNIDDYIYFNYKIKNMNDFALDSVFIGYFMDNDIGPNAEDDLIGFDKKLNLGYSYDYDLKEPGWETSAGYIGTIFVETPRDTIDGEYQQLGLTGFQTWIRSDLGQSEGFAGDVDDDGVDHLKYAELAFVDSFEVYEEPQDVRQLSCSGPVRRLGPGEEISVTLAIVAGASLAELKKNAEAAVEKYNNGFIGPAPPSSPELTGVPGHRKAYLSWSNDPLDDIDPYTGEQDFEGFRVYRSTTGLQDDWELLQDFDIQGDSTSNTATVEYTKGSANAISEFAGVMGDGDLQNIETGNQDEEELMELFYERFKQAEYTIELADDEDTTKLIIYDVSNKQLVPFNFLAHSQGDGFCIYERFNGNRASGKQPDAKYRSGHYIYFNGMYIRISNGFYVDTDQDGMGNGIRDYGEAYTDLNENGQYDQGEPFIDVEEVEKNQQVLAPQEGDIFSVNSYLAQDIGSQTDLEYTYMDEELTNGMTYYYAVTSYDKGYPHLNIPALESSYYQNIQTVMPQHQPLEVSGKPDLSAVEHIGASTGRLLRGMLDYRDLRGHTYEVKFFKNDPDDSKLEADYGVMYDADIAPVQVSNQLLGSGNDTLQISFNLGNYCIMPGSVVLRQTGASSTVGDDSLGRLSGVLGSDSVQGTVHYGKGQISLSSAADFKADKEIRAEYKYSNFRFMQWGVDTLTGTIRKNIIYEAKEIQNDSVAISHGFIFKVESPKLSIDSVAWGLGTEMAKIFRVEITGEDKLEPVDYRVTFPDSGSVSAVAQMTNSVAPDQRMPWKVWNLDENIQSRTFNTFTFLENGLVDWIIDEQSPYDSLGRNAMTVLSEQTRVTKALSPFCFKLNFVPIDTGLATADYLVPPTKDDTLFIFTSRPVSEKDRFKFHTVNMYTPVKEIDMNEIKVVPNPYYVRAAWDQSRYNQRIDFRHLPSGTPDNPVHVRIFNVAGYLIAHLKKDGIVEGNEVLDEYGTLSWDLRNFESLKVASGLYIYQVEAKLNGKNKVHTGKIAIVQAP